MARGTMTDIFAKKVQVMAKYEMVMVSYPKRSGKR